MPTMFEAMVSAYPWDVLDEGIDEVLDRLHGELGATGLILWAGCAPLLHVRGREIEPRIVRSRPPRLKPSRSRRSL